PGRFGFCPVYSADGDWLYHLCRAKDNIQDGQEYRSHDPDADISFRIVLLQFSLHLPYHAGARRTEYLNQIQKPTEGRGGKIVDDQVGQFLLMGGGFDLGSDRWSDHRFPAHSAL